jgi:DNA-binding protein YbaB
MLDNLFGDSAKIQEELAAELSKILITEEVEGITIEANAARQFNNISIPPSFLHEDKKEELEDILLVALNRIQEKIAAAEQEQSASFMKKMLPPGFDNLFQA